MKLNIAVTALLLTSIQASATEHGQCKFTVEGKSYINGRCDFEADTDGSLRISANSRIVYVNVQGGTADASWNKNPKSQKADSPLGDVIRNGECWENSSTKICLKKSSH